MGIGNRMLRRWAATMVLLVGALTSTLARAGEGASEVEAAAQAAFDDGLRLMEAGQYAKACVRLEQSLELAPGMGAQFRLAECYEKSDKVASAWRTYREVAQAAYAVRMIAREKMASERAAALRPRLPMLTIVVPEAVAAVPGLQITRDDQAVPRELWNKPVPVDVATWRLQASAPGRDPWSQSVEVPAEGAQIRAEVPPLSAKPGTEPHADGGLGAQTLTGIVLAAVGVVGMGAGVAIGLEAQPRYDETTEDPELCTPDGLCSQEGLDIRDDVRTQGNIATAVFVIGAASLVGGVVLWVTAPGGEAVNGDDVAAGAKRRVATPQVGLGLTPGGMLVRGSW